MGNKPMIPPPPGRDGQGGGGWTRGGGGGGGGKRSRELQCNVHNFIPTSVRDSTKAQYDSLHCRQATSVTQGATGVEGVKNSMPGKIPYRPNSCTAPRAPPWEKSEQQLGGNSGKLCPARAARQRPLTAMGTSFSTYHLVSCSSLMSMGQAHVGWDVCPPCCHRFFLFSLVLPSEDALGPMHCEIPWGGLEFSSGPQPPRHGRGVQREKGVGGGGGGGGGWGVENFSPFGGHF